MTYREVIRDPDTGEVVAATCVTQPLTDEARAAMVGLARAAQRMWAEEHPDDPDGVKAGERQREKIRALHERVAARQADTTHRCPGRNTPGVPHDHPRPA